jgi:hypothetical protein
MRKPQPFRVQKVSAQFVDHRSQSRVLDHIVATTAIRLITHYRMSEPGKVHTNLMCPSGFQFHVQKRETLITPANLKQG